MACQVSSTRNGPPHTSLVLSQPLKKCNNSSLCDLLISLTSIRLRFWKSNDDDFGYDGLGCAIMGGLMCSSQIYIYGFISYIDVWFVGVLSEDYINGC